MPMDFVKETLKNQIAEKIDDAWEDIEEDLAQVGNDLSIKLNLKAARGGNDIAFLGKLTGSMPINRNYALFDFNVNLDHDMFKDGTKLPDGEEGEKDEKKDE